MNFRVHSRGTFRPPVQPSDSHVGLSNMAWRILISLYIVSHPSTCGGTLKHVKYITIVILCSFIIILCTLYVVCVNCCEICYFHCSEIPTFWVIYLIFTIKEFRETEVPGLRYTSVFKYQSTRRHVEGGSSYVTLDVLVCLLMYNFRNWIWYTRSVSSCHAPLSLILFKFWNVARRVVPECLFQMLSVRPWGLLIFLDNRYRVGHSQG
jgi:hypothetical protein